EILGLHNCITGAPYEMTAQTLQASRVSFVKREDLLRLMRNSPEACVAATQRLSRTCHEAYSQVGSVRFSHSASEKLARFLLTLSTENGSEKDGCDTLRVDLDLTHDEIAQAIGASRETVTRALANFRKKQLANLTRTMLLVKIGQNWRRSPAWLPPQPSLSECHRFPASTVPSQPCGRLHLGLAGKLLDHRLPHPHPAIRTPAEPAFSGIDEEASARFRTGAGVHALAQGVPEIHGPVRTRPRRTDQCGRARGHRLSAGAQRHGRQLCQGGPAAAHLVRQPAPAAFA